MPKLKHGWTLLELIVVVSIIGILVTIGTATYTTVQQKARDSQRKENLRNLRATLILYLQDVDHFPPFSPVVVSTGYPSNSATWIPNLVPDYQPELPTDPTQSAGISNCSSAGFYYCYIIEPGNLEFTLWAQLENTKDPELHTNPNAICQEGPPGGSALNFCINSPVL